MARILFLQRDGYAMFGPMYLSAALKQAGHHTDVLIETEERGRFLPRVAEARPDLVAFSVMTGLHDWAADTARRIKRKMDVHVVAGGPHCTFFPEFVHEDGIDALCRGEAEAGFVEYLARRQSGRNTNDIPGWVFKDGIDNPPWPLGKVLDDLPRPDRALYADRYPGLAHGNRLKIMVARGCPYSCSFCYNQFLKSFLGKNYVRRHSPDRVIAEINDARAISPVSWLQFVDDLFVIDRQWLKTFLDQYRKEVGLPFGCSLRANLVDEDMVSDLARSGCRRVSFGLESGDDSLRNEVLHKRISQDQIVHTAHLLQSYNIRFTTFNMFNLPGETLDKGYKTVALNRLIRKENYPWSGLLQAYRGTPVHDTAMSMGCLPEQGQHSGLFHSPSLRQPDTDKLARLNAYFYWMIRLPILSPLFRLLVHIPIPVLPRLCLLSASFHRAVCLEWPFEGLRSVRNVLVAGLKRLKAYV